MKDKPKISVVIPTYNGSSHIVGVIHTLYKQTIAKSDYEVIVVNNNSTDSTEKVIKELQKIYPELKYLVQKRKGVAPTRNKGVKKAKADIILFLDDDMQASENLLKEHIESHKKHFGTVLGFFVTDWKNKKDVVLDYLEDSGQQNAFNFKDGEIVSYKYFYTGNISVERELFEKAGGFDENFPAPGVEDIDLGYRLYCYGDKILFNQKAASKHIYYPDLKSFKAKKYQIGNPLSYFLEKFPHLKRQFVISPRYRMLVPFVRFGEFFLDPIIPRLPKIFLRIQYYYFYVTIMARLVGGYFKYLPKFKKKRELLQL